MIGAVIDLTHRKRTEAALRGAAERNQALLREADHRIKNNLQLISSVLGLQRASLSDPAARLAFQDARQRIQAIARVHQGFYSTGNFEQADFGEVLCTLRETLLSSARHGPDIVVDAPTGCLIVAAKATPLALIANELITNALKHGFPAGQRGTVKASCSRTPDGEFVLTVSDDGAGLPEEFDMTASAGFGLRLVRTLAAQIGARIAVVNCNPGTAFEVRVPRAVAPSPGKSD
jgi:two-component sensor histidine kinase